MTDTCRPISVPMRRRGEQIYSTEPVACDCAKADAAILGTPEPVTEPVNGDDFAMRIACPRCACPRGRIRRKSGQDVVYCLACDRYQYCAPRFETGRYAVDSPAAKGRGAK